MKKIIEEKGWEQLNDDTKIKTLCEQVLNENPKMMEQYKKGKTKVFKAIMGIISTKTQHRVNMAKVEEALKALLHK